MDNFTPFPALLGGVIIGLASLILLFGIGRIAGISGILEKGLFSWERTNNEQWSVWFILGLILGGEFLLLLGVPAFSTFHPHSIFMIGVGGFLVGLGSRMGSGCTSGHGVCGLGRLSVRSLVAVLVFMGTAILTLAIQRFFS